MNGLRFVKVRTRDGLINLPYRFRRSQRTQDISVTVHSDTIPMVTAPSDYTVEAAESFVRSNGNWVWERIRHLSFRFHLMEHLRERPWINIGRQRIGVQIRQNRGEQNWIHYQPGKERVIFRVPSTDHPEAILAEVFKRFARRHLAPHVMGLADEMQVPLRRLQIMDLLTVWGSCSEDGEVRLNWRVLLLDPELQRHIIFHEFAHLQEFHHYRRFWDLLEQYDPAAFRHDEELAEVSPSLIFLGRG